MAKNIIRLTESDLHRIVKESVQRILSEGNFLPDGYDDDWDKSASLANYYGSNIGHGEAANRLSRLNGNEPHKKEQMDSAWSNQKFDDFQKERYNSPLSKRNDNVENFDSHNGLFDHPAISSFDDANRERGVKVPPRRNSQSYGVPYADMLRRGHDFDHSTM